MDSPGRAADAALGASPGTFITEWTDGEKLCEAFLAGGEEAYGAVAEQLARIAQHYRFDGWLINIENTLSVSRGGPARLPASPCLSLPTSLPTSLPLCCSHGELPTLCPHPLMPALS